jgi:hypothetical protein
MADDEEIVVTGTWRDHISGPIKKSAQSVEHFKGKAESAAVGVEGLSKSEDNAADNARQLGRDATVASKGVDKLGDKSGKAAAKIEALAHAEEKAGDNASEMGRDAAKSAAGLAVEGAAADRTTKQLNQLSRAESRAGRHAGQSVPLWKQLTGAITGAGSGSGSTTRRFGLLGKSMDDNDKKTHKWGRRLLGFIKTIAMLGLKIGVLTSLLTVLGLGIEGLGAAAYAAVAGLAPLTGMIIAYPGLLAAAGQAFAVFKLATSGMGDYLKVRMDPNATAAEIAAASKGMAKSQVKFIDAVAKQKSAWTNLKKSVGGAFFAGLDKTFTNLAETYIPMLNKHLTKTATIMNGIVKKFGKWMGGKEGTSTFAGIMSNNNKIIGNMGPGILNFIKILALLVHDAGPMLIQMSKDVAGLSGDLLGKTRSNEAKLTAFFSHSYDLFKNIARVSGDYVEALYNIGKASKPLSNWMGKKIDLGGQGLLKWTEDEANIKKVRQWFRDMIPVVREIAFWIRDLSLALDKIVGSSDSLKLSKTMRKELLPSLTNFIIWMNQQATPFIKGFSKFIGNLKEAGFLGGFIKAFSLFGKGMLGLSEALAKLPDNMKKLITFVSGIVSIIGMLQLGKQAVGALTGGKIASKITGGLLGKGMGTRVFVTNWPPKFGGPDKPGGGFFGGLGSFGKYVAAVTPLAALAAIGGWAVNKWTPQPDLPTSTNPAAAGGGLSSPNSWRTPDLVPNFGDIAHDMNPGNWGWGLPDDLFGAPSKEATKEVDAYRAQLEETARVFSLLPQDVQTHMVLYGAPESKRAAIDLANTYDLTKKERITLFRALGIPLSSAQVARLLHLYGLVPPDLTTTAHFDAGIAKLRIDSYRSKLASIPGMESATPPKQPRTPKTPNKRPGKPTMQGKGPLLKGYGPPKKVDNPFDNVPKDVTTSFHVKGLPQATNTANKHDKTVRDVPDYWATQFKTLGAEPAITAANNVKDAVNGIDTNKQIDINLALHGLGRFNSAMAALSNFGLYAGGETVAGKTYMTGELGAEAFVTRSGAIKMLGINGPEIGQLGAGAVIPASATADPFRGNTGEAPAWAVQTLQKAVLGGPRGTRDGRDDGMQPLPPIYMDVYPQASFDLELAVKRGIQRAQTEARERG